MNRMLVLLAILSIALVASCDDPERPEAPPPAPQITVEKTWTKMIEKQGTPPVEVQIGLQHNDVFDILLTSNGKLWIGNAQGITQYASREATRRELIYDQSNGLPNPKVRRMVEHNGDIYVATWGGGVGVYNIAGDSWTTLPIHRTRLVNGQVADIDVYNNLVYFATNGGVSIYNPVAVTWTNVVPPAVIAPQCEGCPQDPIVAAVEVENTARGVERWYGPNFEFSVPEAERPRLGITVVRDGVPSPIYFTVGNTALPEPSIMDIMFDSDTGLFWLALRTQGIAVVDVDNSLWSFYTTEDGLPSNTVFSITKHAGRMWVATNNGIAGQRANGTWQGYARTGGLPGDAVRRVWVDSDGKLWMSLVGAGAARVNPASAQGL